MSTILNRNCFVPLAKKGSSSSAASSPPPEKGAKQALVPSGEQVPVRGPLSRSPPHGGGGSWRRLYD
jgi:hypothetical protein